MNRRSQRIELRTEDLNLSVKKTERYREELEEIINIPGTNFQVVEIVPARKGLHEKAEGIKVPVYRLSYPPKHVYLWRLKLPVIKKKSVKCINLAPYKGRMPPKVKYIYDLTNKAEWVKSTALLIDVNLENSHLNMMITVLVGNHWYEVYRWISSWNELGLSRIYFCEF